MKLLIAYENDFFQVNTEDVTRGLLTDLIDGDATAFRYNPKTDQFEEFSPGTDHWSRVDDHEDAQEGEILATLGALQEED